MESRILIVFLGVFTVYFHTGRSHVHISTNLVPPNHNFTWPNTVNLTEEDQLVANNHSHATEENINTSKRHHDHHGHFHKPIINPNRTRYAAGWNEDKTTIRVRARILPGTENDYLPEQENKNDLCALCFCTKNSEEVRCEHNHIAYKDLKHNITLDSQSIPRGSRFIRFIGFDTLHILPNTFASEELNLDLLIFEDIQNLILESQSLYFNRKSRTNILLIVQFIHCHIPTIPTNGITQFIEDPHGNHFGIRRTDTRYLSIAFMQSTVNHIEKNGIAALRLIAFNITSSKIQDLQPEAIDVHVNELSYISHSHLPALKPFALCLHARNVVILNNTILEINKNSLAIETSGKVEIEKNRIGILRSEALMNITLTQRYGGISFLNNQLRKAEPNSLRFNPNMKMNHGMIRKNRFAIPCDCNVTMMLKQIIGMDESDSEDNEKRLSLQEVVKTSQCLGSNSKYSYYIGSYLKTNCAPFPIITVAAVSAAGILFICSVIVCVIYSIQFQHHKEERGKLNECISRSFSTLPKVENESSSQGFCYDYHVSPRSDTTTIQWVAGLPELKTYQQGIAYDLTEQAESIIGSQNRLDTPERRFIARSSCPFN